MTPERESEADQIQGEFTTIVESKVVKMKLVQLEVAVPNRGCADRGSST